MFNNMYGEIQIYIIIIITRTLTEGLPCLLLTLLCFTFKTFFPCFLALFIGFQFPVFYLLGKVDKVHSFSPQAFQSFYLRIVQQVHFSYIIALQFPSFFFNRVLSSFIICRQTDRQTHPNINKLINLNVVDCLLIHYSQ